MSLIPVGFAFADTSTEEEILQQRRQLDMFDPAEHRDTHDSTQHTAVDGQTALPNIQNGNGVCGIGIPGENAVIQTGAQDGKGRHPQHTIQNIIFPETKLCAAAAAVHHRQGKADRDDDTVEVNTQRANLQISRGIHGDSQIGKGNNRIIHGVHRLYLLLTRCDHRHAAPVFCDHPA